MRREEVLSIVQSQTVELERFGVRSLRLFGSVAHDEATAASDVDLLVDFEQPPGFSKFVKLRIFLEDLLGAEVDLVTGNKHCPTTDAASQMIKATASTFQRRKETAMAESSTMKRPSSIIVLAA